MSAGESKTNAWKNFPFAFLIFGSYALLLFLLLSRHEVWRDEMRAYSLARSAPNPVELIQSTLNHDGHPGLWHLLLWCGCQVTDNPVVLKIASYLVALGFSGLFFFFSPFPLLHRCLFLLGLFPLHLYSVVSRNYGIAVLLMFLQALEYTRRDRGLSWRAGLSNALLANTNIYGSICAVAFLFVPLRTEPNTRRRWVQAWGTTALFTLAGLCLAAYTVWPRPGNLALDRTTTGPLPAHTHSVAALRADLLALGTDRELWTAFILTGDNWKSAVADSFPRLVALGVSAGCLWGLLALLLRWPWVLVSYAAAFGAAGLFSRQVYPAQARHLGMLSAFLLTLLWIAWTREPAAQRTRSKVFLWVLGLCLLAQATAGLRTTFHWLDRPYSQSKNAGTFLAASYPTAILVGEPDYYLESLPFYSPNSIYLVREQRFRNYITFTTDLNRPVTLTELMATADRLHTETGKPVLITLFAPIETLPPGICKGGFGRNLTLTTEEITEFRRRFVEVGAFTGKCEENYVFYKHRAFGEQEESLTDSASGGRQPPVLGERGVSPLIQAAKSGG